MITGAHAVLYSRDAEAARAFFRDVLRFPSVDSGAGWLIFAMPPSELGIHPSEGDAGPEIYLMCDDLERTIADLRGRGAEGLQEIKDEGWGVVTSLSVPGAGSIGLYQPRHPTALSAT